MKTRKVKLIHSKPGTFKRLEGKEPQSLVDNRQNVGPWFTLRKETNSTKKLYSNSISKLPTHRPFTKQMNSVSGGSFGNLCGRGKELSTDSEHQPISRSRVDKCSATLVAVSVENISVEAPRPQRARYKASEAGF